jgi:hypothetical protein
MRLDQLIVLDRVLARLPEIASWSLEEHVVRLFVVPRSDGARYDCALGILLRD